MATQWRLRALYAGKIRIPKTAATPGLDPDIVYDAPYLAFLLLSANRIVLVDTGISEKFIIDGKAWGGFPAEGGQDYLLRSLAGAGVNPAEVDTVIFTHLHNDHAGNTMLFENARLIFQKDEWKTLLDPLPVMQLRKDYDPAVVEHLRNMNCTLVDGDLELDDGIMLLKTPGHTPGSQSVMVHTDQGLRILVGDHWPQCFNAFSQMTEFVDLNGDTRVITPAPAVYGRFIPPSVVYDYYDWYDSCHKIMALMGTGGPECIVAGHEPLLLR